MGLGGRAGWHLESRLSCPRPEEPPRVWCGAVTGWDWRRDCHRGNSLLRKQGACLEVNGQGQLRDGRDSGWCRDSRGGDRWMTLGCILKVNLIGLPEALLREVGARPAAVHRLTEPDTSAVTQQACVWGWGPEKSKAAVDSEFGWLREWVYEGERAGIKWIWREKN